MGRGLELAGKGLGVLLVVGGCGGESSGGEATAPAATKAANVIMGTVVHTENAGNIPVGVRAYVDPHDLTKRENGSYPEAARVPLICFEIGRLGVDADVPGPDSVQWSVWYEVNGLHNDQPQWLPQPYVQTDMALPRCP
jgi:hypothetical protein